MTIESLPLRDGWNVYRKSLFVKKPKHILLIIDTDPTKTRAGIFRAAIKKDAMSSLS
jgi:hypothetical protein